MAITESPASPSWDGAAPLEVREPKLLKGRLLRLFVFVVLNGIVLNLLFFAVNQYLVRHNLGEKSHGTFGPLKSLSTFSMGMDSFGAMLPALHVVEANRAASPYELFFFRSHQASDYRMFQYPLSSLLPYYFLQKLGISDNGLFRISTAVFWFSAWGVILVAFLIARRNLPNPQEGEIGSRRATFLTAVNVGLAGILFYPLTKSFSLGQIQANLSFGFALALYCWISGREKSAGAVMGLLTLVKPQYGVFLFWALLRKKLGAFAAGATVAGIGLLTACLLFGLQNNLEYLKVIHVISLHGAGFYPNQSVNGMLNRLLFNGNNLIWDNSELVPYNSIVYFGTLVSSLALLAFALFFPWGTRRRGGVADFMCCVLTATMASPVAWEHHYGILLPIFAWLWFQEYGGGARGKNAFPIAVAYVLASNFILPVSAFARLPLLNILQSYLYLGAIIVMVLLVKSRSQQLTPAAFSKAH